MSDHRTRRPVALALALLAAGALLLVPAGAPALAQSETAVDQPDEERVAFLVGTGRLSYRRYCGSCHGATALGDGSVAQYLTVKPANLKEISLRNDGVFPLDMVVQVIDGRTPVSGHGSADMPVWGDVFQTASTDTAEMSAADREKRASEKILGLAYYLESIQTAGDTVEEK